MRKNRGQFIQTRVSAVQAPIRRIEKEMCRAEKTVDAVVFTVRSPYSYIWRIERGQLYTIRDGPAAFHEYMGWKR